MCSRACLHVSPCPLGQLDRYISDHFSSERARAATFFTRVKTYLGSFAIGLLDIQTYNVCVCARASFATLLSLQLHCSKKKPSR